MLFLQLPTTLFIFVIQDGDNICNQRFLLFHLSWKRKGYCETIIMSRGMLGDVHSFKLNLTHKHVSALAHLFDLFEEN